MVYLATTPPAGRGILRYIDADWRGVDKETLLAAAGSWSSGEALITKIALDLFDPGCVAELGYEVPGPGRMCGTLDEDSYDAVANAMRIARGELHADFSGLRRA